MTRALSHAGIRAWLIGGYVAVCVAMLALAALHIGSEYRRLDQEAAQGTARLAAVLREHVGRTFALIDVQLRDLGQRIARRRLLEDGGAQLSALLRENAERSGLVTGIYVYDAEGRGHATSLAADIRHLHYTRADHTRGAFESREDKLFFGRTERGPVTGRLNLPIARRIVDRDGALAGLIGSALDYEYLVGFYSSLYGSSRTSVVLLRADGVVLATFPDSSAIIEGGKLRFLVERAAKEPAGTFRTSSDLNKRPLLFSFSRVSGYDLVVAVGESEEAWLGAWRRNAAVWMGTILVFLAAILGLLLFVLKGLSRHAEEVERYALVERGSMDGIWDWDPLRLKSHLSRRFSDILGYTEGEFTGLQDPLLRLALPEDRERAREEIRRQLREGDAYSTELRIRHKEGRYVWILVRGTALRGADGAITRMTGTIRDISAQKNVETVLRNNEVRIRLLFGRLVEAQEAERHRFAADLHDLVAQNVSAIGMELETLRSALAAGAPVPASALDTLEDLVSSAMASVRQVMADFRPALLEDYGLEAALRSHARSVERWSDLAVTVATDGPVRRAPAAVELALFRIAQEALANAARHSGGSRARIGLSDAGCCARLCVEDNGRGIASAVANGTRGNGWGTALMGERAKALDGRLSIEDTGAGTRVVAEIPYGDTNPAG